MKKTKVLIPALGILCLSMAASVTGTFAWFAANQTVYAKNMQVKSSTPASLVIGKTFNTVGKAQTITYDAPDTVPALAPATHDTNMSTYNTGLKVVTNGDLIDPDTGLIKSDAPTGSALTYGNAAANTNFIDYVAYIASAGDAIGSTDPKKLSVTLDYSSTGTGDTISACSIDFYVKSVTATGTATTNTDAPVAADFRGTLNIAGLDPVENDFTTAKTSVDLIASTATMAIPTETSASAVKVVMRVYFDGALLQSAGQAFVYTNSIDTHDITLNTTFSITDAA